GRGVVEWWSQCRLLGGFEQVVDERRLLGGRCSAVETTAHGPMLADDTAPVTVGLLDANDEMAMLRQYVVRCPDC
ncbi:MAG: hypothetical protein VX304_08335, partial [Planctomycetota bacterium]|nr:hypothetical protein [Planctomycetota bacterium]